MKTNDKTQIVKIILTSLLISYIFTIIITFIQLYSSERVNYYLISLIIMSQTSIAGPVLGFYFADNTTNSLPSNRDDENKRIIEIYEREKLEEFDKRLK